MNDFALKMTYSSEYEPTIENHIKFMKEMGCGEPLEI